ncbi:hypothetical protein BA196_15260 [Klebsiella pneumoniae]|nr:hypothetical protein BA196_15260 [Klebsiella pneumoniae]
MQLQLYLVLFWVPVLVLLKVVVLVTFLNVVETQLMKLFLLVFLMHHKKQQIILVPMLKLLVNVSKLVNQPIR